MRATHEQQSLAPGVFVLVPAALPFDIASTDLQLERLVELVKIGREHENMAGMLLEDEHAPRSVRRYALPLRAAAGREAVDLMVELGRASPRASLGQPASQHPEAAVADRE